MSYFAISFENNSFFFFNIFQKNNYKNQLNIVQTIYKKGKKRREIFSFSWYDKK